MVWIPDWLSELFGYKSIERVETVAENLARERPSGIIEIINGIEFEFLPDRIIQRGGSLKKEVNIFVGGDYHGYYNNAQESAKIAKNLDVDFIVVNGDSNHGNPARGLGKESGSYASKLRKKFDSRMDCVEEIVAVIEPFAQTGIPVGVNPGNQEERDQHSRALSFLCRKYSNVFDLSQIRVIELLGVNLASNPYGDDNTYERTRGFGGTPEEIESFVSYIESIQNQYLTILVTHQPHLCFGEEGIDHTFHSIMQGSNTILNSLRKLRKKGKKVSELAQHFHEKTQIAVDFDLNRIPEGEYVTDFSYTPGAGSPWQDKATKEFYYGHAGLVTIDTSRILIKYQGIVLPFPEKREGEVILPTSN